MKTITILLLFISLKATAQINIPDANFKYLLILNKDINTNWDLEIDSIEAANYTGAIDVSNEGINDLTGIEHFISLTYLDCSDNNLTELNISSCDSLKELKIHNNQLITLDVSNNKKLSKLFVSMNELVYVDVRNGNNKNLSFVGILNPNMCVSVDNSTYSNDNWSDLKDITSTYSNDCLVGIEKKKKILKLKEFTIYTDVECLKLSLI